MDIGKLQKSLNNFVSETKKEAGNKINEVRAWFGSKVTSGLKDKSTTEKVNITLLNASSELASKSNANAVQIKSNNLEINNVEVKIRPSLSESKTVTRVENKSSRYKTIEEQRKKTLVPQKPLPPVPSQRSGSQSSPTAPSPSTIKENTSSESQIKLPFFGNVTPPTKVKAQYTNKEILALLVQKKLINTSDAGLFVRMRSAGGDDKTWNLEGIRDTIVAFARTHPELNLNADKILTELNGWLPPKDQQQET